MSETIAEKVAHVRTAEQTRKHTCHWPGCLKQVPPALWGCKPHWYKLPPVLRNRIWNAYKIGQENGTGVSREYVEAAKHAQEWIAAHFTVLR